ncbi:zinc finger protein Eos isoform X2 [Syngnathoides biaculeatus]|uniref:zinc finger protein Eos isoform X2 n=1 Tax=Syngnathoides biaculeatus TaxID=300417 RepID=UPI002ADDEA04|nr:zinc finger protein Eos isoform X2 [Syngnathoides biaculeatus]
MQASGERMNADDCNGCSHASGNGQESLTEQHFFSPSSQQALTCCSFAANSIKVELCSGDKSPQPHKRGVLGDRESGDDRLERIEEGSLEHAGLEQRNIYGELATSKAASPGSIRLPNGKLQCDVCGIICIGPNVLMVHKRSHTGERPFHCNQCGASFTQKGNLLRHIKLHSGEKPFKCPICNYACRRRDALAGHLRTHADTSPLGGKPFKCIYCSRSYKQQSTLEDHFDRCHSFPKRQDQEAAVNSKTVQQDDQSVKMETMGKPTLDNPNEKPRFADRLAGSITKRKRSTPQKFLADKQIHLELLEVPCDLSSGSEREGEHLKPQPVGDATGLSGKNVQDSSGKRGNDLLHPAFSSELHTIMDSTNSNVIPQGAPGGVSMVTLGLSGQEVGEGGEVHPSVHSHTTSPNGCPDSTDTESTAEDLSTRAAVHTRTSKNNQHLHYQTLALPQSLSTASLSQAKETDPEWDSPSPPTPVKGITGSPLLAREKVQVLDRDGQPMRYFHCRHCRVLFLDHVMFTIHMGCHGFHQPFECNICGHRSLDRYEFSSHMSRGEHLLD